MAEESKSSAPDSPQVSALKFKRDTLTQKLKFLGTQKSTPDFDIEAATSRTHNQLAEVESALKGVK